MGASGWAYFVPYQTDIRHALHELRQSLFQRGEYSLRDPYWKALTFEEWIEPADADAFDDDERAEYTAEYQRLQSLKAPTIIDELLDWNGEEGTSSILDIRDVSETPQPFTVSPLTDTQLITLFGTTHPTHEMLDRVRVASHEFRKSWSGLYIILYQNDTAHEIFFTGVSGD